LYKDLEVFKSRTKKNSFSFTDFLKNYKAKDEKIFRDKLKNLELKNASFLIREKTLRKFLNELLKDKFLNKEKKFE